MPPSDCDLDARTAHELLAHPVRRAAVAALAEAAPLSTTELARLVAARDHPEPSARPRDLAEREVEIELSARHLPKLESACVVQDTDAGYDCGRRFDSLLQVFDTTEELVR
ncbi:DUF7344 domain-containing protein [Halorarius litoreus]|uniref:DUF7344 domain-containing protein n=1 Tax=Halorarius litoreus TaxID=2962676 RepID=UPI0020CBE2D0|nr:hypothetical protein [Halorarius litoreus]